MIKILHGDSKDLLRTIESNSIDSVVTDPPYEFGFMNKKWDRSGIAYDIKMWEEVLRVLKPGGHLLSFGGTRTYHRMVCAIEDAGFEIRDSIQWIYGSGFPKSLNISKAIDKFFGAERQIIGKITEGRGAKPRADFRGSKLYAKNTEKAKQWDGYGTALKPAHEPIVVARKPLDGTVVQNIMRYGCGGVNIDGCRIKHNEEQRKQGWNLDNCGFDSTNNFVASANSIGRFPSNIIHDGSDEVINLFPNQKSGKMTSVHKRHTDGSPNGIYGRFDETYPLSETIGDKGSASRFFMSCPYEDDDLYPILFYVAKPSVSEKQEGVDDLEEKKMDEGKKDGNPGGDNHRNRGLKLVKNNHPTVKPIKLMRYLIRLVTPINGTVLDPFAGSGTTLIACIDEKMSGIGIEREYNYVNIIKSRLDYKQKTIDLDNNQLRLF